MCINIQGSYTCACPKGYHGNGTKDGEGCSAYPASTLAIKISIGKYIYCSINSSNAWVAKELAYKICFSSIVVAAICHNDF
jgi:hypothetical protein